VKTGRENVRTSTKVQFRNWWRRFLKNFGKIHKFWSLGLEVLQEVSVSKVWSRLHHCYLVLPTQKQKHSGNWSVKFFILCIRFSKISLFRMVLKRLELQQMTPYFDCVAWNFSYTQACKLTPSDNTVWQHQCCKPSTINGGLSLAGRKNNWFNPKIEPSSNYEG